MVERGGFEPSRPFIGTCVSAFTRISFLRRESLRRVRIPAQTLAGTFAIADGHGECAQDQARSSARRWAASSSTTSLRSKNSRSRVAHAIEPADVADSAFAIAVCVLNRTLQIAEIVRVLTYHQRDLQRASVAGNHGGRIDRRCVGVNRWLVVGR